MTPPPACPYSALKPLVSTVNSVSASTEGVFKRGFSRVARAIGADGVAVERRVPGGNLSASQRQLLAISSCLGRDRHQIERTAHGAGDNQRQFVDQLVLHLCRNLRVVGLNRGGGG